MTESRVMHFWMEHGRPEELSWTTEQFANLCGSDKHGLQANWTSTVEDVTCVKCKEKLKKLYIHYWRNTYSRVGDILKLHWPTDDQKTLCNKFSDFFTESEESVTCPDCRAYIEKANGPRCTCIDNQWSCEKHNGDRDRENPLHYRLPNLGIYCGKTGRSTDSLPNYQRHSMMHPEDTCPTCAIYVRGDLMQETNSWNGMCLANKHGLDYEGQNCDQCMVDAGIKSTPATHDAVNKPKHYNAGKVECIDALEAATIDLKGIEAVCTANVIKYLWRWKLNNGAEDLKKAKWYLERLIKKVESMS